MNRLVLAALAGSISTAAMAGSTPPSEPVYGTAASCEFLVENNWDVDPGSDNWLDDGKKRMTLVRGALIPEKSYCLIFPLTDPVWGENRSLLGCNGPDGKTEDIVQIFEGDLAATIVFRSGKKPISLTRCNPHEVIGPPAASISTTSPAPDGCQVFIMDNVNIDRSFGMVGGYGLEDSYLTFDDEGGVSTGDTLVLNSSPPNTFYRLAESKSGKYTRYAFFDISAFAKPGAPTYFLLYGDEMYWPVCDRLGDMKDIFKTKVMVR
jgi:hypothetical protein